jgi:hypothetical protein
LTGGQFLSLHYIGLVSIDECQSTLLQLPEICFEICIWIILTL